MSSNPLLAVVVLFTISLVVLGHSLRVCEEGVFNAGIDGYIMNFGIYWNCFWCIIITMTTIGYGDYYPCTVPGRVVIFVTSIWGVFLVSILVIALNNTLQMDGSES